MPNDASDFEDFQSEYKALCPGLEPGIADDIMVKLYEEFIARSAEATASFQRLLSNDRRELISCVKNLTRVIYMSFDGTREEHEERRLYYGARHPRALQQHEIYLSMLPEAFVQANVRVGNMLAHGTVRYLALNYPRTAEGMNPNTIRDQLKDLEFDVVAFRRNGKDSCINYDWASVLGANNTLKHLVFRNQFQREEDQDFSTLCGRMLEGPKSHRNLSSIRLVGVRISLLELAEMVVTWKRRVMPLHFLDLLNVRAEDRKDWRQFMELLRQACTQTMSNHWHVKECPHPAKEGGSKEWEHISDILADFGGDGICADIAGYLYHS